MVSFAACEQVIPSLATEILTLFAALFLLLGAVSSNIMLLVLEGAAQAAMKDRENRIKGITVDHIELNLSASSKLMTKLLHLCGKSFICDVDRKPQYLSSDAEWELNRRAPRLSSYIAPPILPLPSLDGDEDDDVSVDSRRDDSFDTKDSFDHEEYQPPPPPMPPPDEGVGGGGEVLPPGWTIQDSENGVYYWNFQTGETAWDFPTAASSGSIDVAPPPGSPPESESSILPPPMPRETEGSVILPPPMEVEMGELKKSKSSKKSKKEKKEKDKKKGKR